MRLLSLQQSPRVPATTIPSKVTLYCDYCNKEFTRPRCQLLKSDARFGSKNYCSRPCFAKCRPKRYDKFLYCNECKWILQKDVIIKLINGIKYSHCPKCKSKVRKNSIKPKFNHSRRNIKRI